MGGTITNQSKMEIPDRQILIEMAGERAFRRGEEYCAWQCVRALASNGEQLSAFVYGGRRYRVTIRMRGEDVDSQCDCPEGASGRFCKHCVAVCLEYKEGVSDMEHSPMTLQDLRSYLVNLPVEELVGMVMDEAFRKAEYRERLYLRMSRADERIPDLTEYRRLIEFASEAVAVECDEETFDVVLSDVESSLINLVEAGYAEEAASLIEGAPVYFLPGRTEFGERLVTALLSLHERCCIRLDLNGESLATRLLRWQMSSGVNGIEDLAQRYADMLGLRGRKEYDRLVRSEWDRLLANVEARQDGQSLAFKRLTGLLEKWAEFQGDIDLLISVKSHRIHEASDYVEIARLCRRKGREEAALQWAERGRNIFQANEAGELFEFLAMSYESNGEWGKALEILYDLYQVRPSLDLYQRMAGCARQIGEWGYWREQALNVARRDNAAVATRLRSLRVPATDRSALVSILIWEKDIRAALEEALKGGCDDDLWLELARQLAGTHPDEALEIYQRLVTKYSNAKNGYAYKRAIEVLRRAGQLMKKQKRRDEFLDYVKSLRRKHRSQHSLARLLDRLLAKHATRTAYHADPARRV